MSEQTALTNLENERAVLEAEMMDELRTSIRDLDSLKTKVENARKLVNGINTTQSHKDYTQILETEKKRLLEKLEPLFEYSRGVDDSDITDNETLAKKIIDEITQIKNVSNYPIVASKSTPNVPRNGSTKPSTRARILGTRLELRRKTPPS